jgi:hypothetical protein
MPGFTLKSRSRVQKHPNPRRIIEFYGGEAVGVTPNLSYGALFDYLYATENTVIAMPVPIGPNHEEIARFLIEERRIILDWLGYNPDSQPSCMVGHSIGGQMIALLASLTDIKTNKFMLRGQEERTGLMGTPMLFIAPFIGDFNAPNWANWLVKALRLSFKPTMEELIDLLKREPELFAKAGLLSFASDKDAGHKESCPEPIEPTCKMSVPWFHSFLQGRNCNEIPGDHLAPMGTLIGDTVYRPSIDHFSEQFPRQVDKAVVSLLNQIDPPEATVLGAALARSA